MGNQRDHKERNILIIICSDIKLILNFVVELPPNLLLWRQNISHVERCIGASVNSTFSTEYAYQINLLLFEPG
jgi:hypothetical protein